MYKSKLCFSCSFLMLLPHAFANKKIILPYFWFGFKIFKKFLTVAHEPVDPCRPSPCGPYSVCNERNGHAICSCQPSYIGAPPMCRPECVVSSECSLDKSCINQKCKDPCPGTCGLNARCQVVNHNPICSCNTGFTGDPFTRCISERKNSFFLFYLFYFLYFQIFHFFSNSTTTRTKW